VIPETFSARLRTDGAQALVQVIADGAEPNTAAFVQNYARGALQSWLQVRGISEARETGPLIELEQRVWYNPSLASRNVLVPGSIAVIMTLIGTLLTALVVSREWERGTMEALMATPIGIIELLVGKLVPYFLLGLVSMAICVALALTLFGVPLRGSFWVLVLATAVFLLAALGQGLLISSAARSQFVASQLAVISGFLPAFLLSGLIFEISSMPLPVQALSHVVQARYFVTVLRTLFLTGDVWPLLLPNLAAMLAIAAVFFGLSARVTRKRLD
jgi:ABC-2 type transport system permease protein